MADLVEIRMPADEQEGTESVVSNWLKQPGDTVKQHEPLVEINTDKVTVEVAAPASGILKEIKAPVDTEITPETVLGLIDPQKIEDSEPSVVPVQKTTEKKESSIRLSPAVKKLVAKHGIDPAKLTGTGREGRITRQDVLNFVEGGAKTTEHKSDVPSRMVPHTQMRKKIAKHMLESMTKAPHVTNLFEVDLEAVIQHRNAHKSYFEEQGTKLTFSSYFVEAICKALEAVPEANSRWHDDALEIFEDFNIGIATALGDQGLIVPVLKKAQGLSLEDIASKVQELTTKAREGKLEPKDVQDGTITISNHGVSGSLLAAPIIINQPQVAILGIGKLEERPKVVDGEIVIRKMVYATLSIDHRVLDGFSANKFLETFKAKLESY